MDILYSISATSILLGVCVTTVRRWERAGKIICFRTLGGHRRFSLGEIRRVLLGRKRREKTKVTKNRTIVYSRVSSHDQKDDLVRQEEKLEKYCKDNKLNNVSIYKDIASGLNVKRRGLLRTLKQISRGNITHLLLTFRDRLTRFGFEYLQIFCQYFGCEIIAISEEDKVEKSMEQELVEDLVSIITSFSGRLHGMRSAEKRRKKKVKS